MQEDGDWEITPDGLYRATRGFLIRRGYCCGNRCSNCPYINWRMNDAWHPGPAEAVRKMHVARRSLQTARALLTYHQKQLAQAEPQDESYHQQMIQHYRFLLERWEG